MKKGLRNTEKIQKASKLLVLVLGGALNSVVVEANDDPKAD